MLTRKTSFGSVMDEQIWTITVEEIFNNLQQQA